MFLKGTTKNTFLSKMLTSPVRNYSRAAVQTFVSAMNNTIQTESQENLEAHNRENYQKLQDYSVGYLKEQQAKEAAEAEWLASLRSPQ